MVAVAQLVRALDCGSSGRGFESPQPPQSFFRSKRLRNNMDSEKSKIIMFFGIISIFVTGLIHAIEAPDAFHEAFYKGALFCLNAFCSLFAAIGIYMYKKVWGWRLGFLIAVFSIILYVISRTIGLPNIPAEPDEWFEPLGVVSLFAESLFIIFFIKALKKELRD